MKIIKIVIALVLIVILFRIPIWSKHVKNGKTKINTFEVIGVITGVLKID